MKVDFVAGAWTSLVRLWRNKMNTLTRWFLIVLSVAAAAASVSSAQQTPKPLTNADSSVKRTADELISGLDKDPEKLAALDRLDW